MNKKNNEGFTLVEVLAVVVILGILMTIAMPTYNSVYNSVKRSTYLNKIKTVTVAAKSYANNSEVKDSIQEAYQTSTSGQWYKIVKISDLIESGAIQGDGDYTDDANTKVGNYFYVSDIYTGTGLGYNNEKSDYTNYCDKMYPCDGCNAACTADLSKAETANEVALLYCYDKYDVDAFLINDLGTKLDLTDDGYTSNKVLTRTYHEGEIVRNTLPVGTNTFHEFGTLKVDLSYSKLAKKLYTAYENGVGTITYKGIKISLDTITNSGRTYSSINDGYFLQRVNQTIMDYLTTDTDCSHK